MLKREMRRGNRKIIEIRQESEIKTLDFLSLLPRDLVQKELILHLANFFCREDQNSNICRNIFRQVLEARNQRLQSTQELLIATILEGSLRTLYNYPVHRQDNSKGLIQKTLNGRFKRDYLSNRWRKPCNRAIKAFLNLRTRNAHPDWLTSVEGSMSDEQRTQALDDMIYLCHFYGYMVLALSGFKELEPIFPEPHRNWPPVATITKLPPSQKFDDLPENNNRYRKMLAARRRYQTFFNDIMPN